MTYNDLRKGRWSSPGHVYALTFVTHARLTLFEDFTLGRIVIAEMLTLHEQGAVDSLAFVVMPDHLHWLVTLNHGKLAGVAQTMKGRSARRINKERRKTGPVWQPGCYDHALRADDDLRKQARFITANPIRAGLVGSIGDYPLWDAAWLELG